MRKEEQLLGFDIREMWAQMDATWPESLTKKWTFLGYDVADDGFISGLSDCRYEADELHLRAGWEL